MKIVAQQSQLAPAISGSPAGDIVTEYVAPTKEEIRRWLSNQIASRQAPPSLAEIRRDLWRVKIRQHSE